MQCNILAKLQFSKCSLEAYIYCYDNEFSTILIDSEYNNYMEGSGSATIK